MLLGIPARLETFLSEQSFSMSEACGHDIDHFCLLAFVLFEHELNSIDAFDFNFLIRHKTC